MAVHSFSCSIAEAETGEYFQVEDLHGLNSSFRQTGLHTIYDSGVGRVGTETQRQRGERDREENT